jgi:hypothetical protein
VRYETCPGRLSQNPGEVDGPFVVVVVRSVGLAAVDLSGRRVRMAS